MSRNKMKIVLALSVITTISAQLNQPRHPAEWEEIESVIMEGDHFFTIPSAYEESLEPYLKVAKACIDENVDFYLIDPDTSSAFSLEMKTFDWDTCFSNRGLSSPRLHFIKVDNDDKFMRLTWARDHEPYSVYKNGVDTMFLAGLKDNDIYTSLMSKTLGIPVTANIPGEINTENNAFYWDGGNFLTDGHGTFNIANSFADGGFVDPALPAIKNYLGIQKTMNVNGVSVHVDYWLKMINEETCVVSYVPETNYLYDNGYLLDVSNDLQNKIESAVTEIKKNIKSVFGRDIKFIPIQNAPSFNDVAKQITYFTESASYTNSLILNKTVLVPQYQVEPTDSLALKAYRDAMPGYNIIGVNTRINAAGSGAIHCMTREIYAKTPIYMKHKWYKDTIDNMDGYPLTIEVKSIKGIKSVKLFWSINGSGVFQEQTMDLQANNIYTSTIPAQSDGTQINYYITAVDMDSKEISKPFVAPKGFYSFVVKGGKTAIDVARSTAESKMLKIFTDGNELTINANGSIKDYVLTIYSLRGQILKKQTLNEGVTKLALTDVPAGTYMISVKNANTSFTKNVKFCKN